MKPIFKNKENPAVNINDTTVWLSRSCAVVAEVLLHNTEDNCLYVLLGKRGPNTPDYQNYWGLPCGYLDWNETLQEAVLREVFEECGLYLPNLKNNKSFLSSKSQFVINEDLNKEQPWTVFSNPTGKQNISMHYQIMFSWNGKFPELSFDNADEGEVSELAWVKLNEAIKQELAFNHERCLKMLIDNNI